MAFSKKHGSKRSLNLIMHIMVIKYSEKAGKIRFNRSDKMEISKSDIFLLTLYKMLLCILIYMDVRIISYSSYVFENFRFWQIPQVNPSLKMRFPDEKMIMKISFQTENFAQNWLPDVIFWSEIVTGQKLTFKTDRRTKPSGNFFWTKNYVR